MNPLNFFPCITDEYRQSIRDFFCLAPEEKIKYVALEQKRQIKLKEVINEEKYYPFDELLQPRKAAVKGSVFDLMGYFQGERETSLVRCLKNGDDDDDVSFQVVNPVTSLKGKYVLLVCCFVPSKWSDYNAERLCRLWALSKEIASVDDFEILIVAKMRKQYDSNLSAFNLFLSAFPNRLAISFDYFHLRDEFCYDLDFKGVLKGILIDPNGKILQDDLSFIDEYGASAFPFTDDSLNKFGFPSESLTVEQVFGDMLLTTLLRCHPSTRLSKFGFPSESITIEQLSKKLVGLYLFRLGDKLDKLHEVYHLCQLSDKAKDVEPQFEIVLFCSPVGAIDPTTFQLEVHEFLKLKPDIDVSSWWVCPYDNSAGLYLLNVSRFFYVDNVDALVSIGADGKFIDFCGGEVLNNVGYEAYPFSVKALIQRFVLRADQTTFESLFTCVPNFIVELVKQDGSLIDHKELQFKNVLLYVDSIPSSNHYNLDKLIKWYPKIKQYEPDVEVVFVSYTDSEPGSIRRPESKSGIPWIVCPYYPELAGFLQHHSAFYGCCDGKRILKGLRPGSVVAFGKGGCIHVLDATLYLLHEGPDSNPFSPGSRDLRRDVYRQMHHDIDFMRPLPSNLY